MTQLLLYKEIIDTIGAVGDALTKIVDGIKHLVVTGTSRYNYVSAERERKRLIEISARASLLTRISELRPPETAEEKESLRDLNTEYKRLLASFSEAIKLLNDYLKQNNYI